MQDDICNRLLSGSQFYVYHRYYQAGSFSNQVQREQENRQYKNSKDYKDSLCMGGGEENLTCRMLESVFGTYLCERRPFITISSSPAALTLKRKNTIPTCIFYLK